MVVGPRSVATGRRPPCLGLLSLIFIRMIRTIIAPLLFATLVVGIAGHPTFAGRAHGPEGAGLLRGGHDARAVHWPRGSTSAKPGWAWRCRSASAGRRSAPRSRRISRPDPARLPENVAKAMADGQVLQIVVFSIVFAIALGLLGDESAGRCCVCRVAHRDDVQVHEPRDALRAGRRGAAIAYTVGHMGLGILVNLVKAARHALRRAPRLPAPRPAAGGADPRVPVLGFLKAIAEPVSSPSPPRARRRAAARDGAHGGVRRAAPDRRLRHAAGYSFNLDGTTLYLSLARSSWRRPRASSSRWGSSSRWCSR